MPPLPPDADPLLAEMFAIAGGLDWDELRAPFQDPAFLSLVERAVAPYANVFTPEGLEEARQTATLTLAARSDVTSLIEQERARLASGTRTVAGEETPDRERGAR
jgi:hypothetical protein